MNFLTAEWRKLLMLNYLVDPELLQPYLPYGTELDYWNGKLHVSLVGFMFLNTKVLGLPIPFHRNFEEMNLRFYVRYKHGEEWRRGVVFIREIVPKFMISFVANTIYGEHYETLPMHHLIEKRKNNLRVEYHVKKMGRWHKIIVDAPDKLQKIETSSEVEFITEHFWGYTKLNDKKTLQYEVGHPTWDYYEISNCQLDGDFTQIYGNDFDFMNQKPDSVFLAEGSEIYVRKGGQI
ncbi:DUF2071 domain-containing protein [Aureispira]|nr:DUF2071 domain-containing protein [Aureispira sp.]